MLKSTVPKPRRNSDFNPIGAPSMWSVRIPKCRKTAHTEKTRALLRSLFSIDDRFRSQCHPHDQAGVPSWPACRRSPTLSCRAPLPGRGPFPRDTAICLNISVRYDTHTLGVDIRPFQERCQRISKDRKGWVGMLGVADSGIDHG